MDKPSPSQDLSGTDELYAQALDLASEAAAGAGQAVRLRVVSASMSPFLWVGDYVVAVPTPPAGLRCGDLVVVRQAGTLLTHRLLAVTPGGLLTKADAFLRPDPIHPLEALLGRVCLVERGGCRRDLTLPAWQKANRSRGRLGLLEAAISRGLHLIWPKRWNQAPLAAAERVLNVPFRRVGYLIQLARRTETTF